MSVFQLLNKIYTFCYNQMDSVCGLCFNRPKDVLKLQIPDGSTVGPVLPTFDSITDLKTIKDIRKKFSYSNSTYAIPTSINPINSSFIVREYSQYKNNLVRSFNIKDIDYIAYTKPSSNSSSTFCLSEICEDVSNKLYSLKNTTQSDSYNCIKGLDVSIYGDNTLALLLTENGFNICEIPSTRPIVQSITERKIADGHLHKIFKNYFTIIENEGSVYVFNYERNIPCWKKDIPSKSLKYNSFLSCQFGYHPLSVFVSSDENIMSYDTRMKAKCQNNTIFSLNCIGSSFEQTICSTEFKQSPYMYVNCTHTVYLIDERYVKTPVVSWNHLLSTEPKFSNLITINYKDILSISNSYDKVACFISTKSHELGSAKTYIPETGLPSSFYPIEDTLDFANNNNLWYHSTVKNRYSSSWLGFTTQKINNDKICLWMQNVYGDIMYQIYNPTEVEVVCNSFQKLKSYENHILRNIKQKESLKYAEVKNLYIVKKNSRHTEKGVFGKYIRTCETSKMLYWDTKNYVKQRRNKKASSTKNFLMSGYEFQNIQSPEEFINSFPSYKHNLVDSLKSSSENKYKSKLMSIWSNKPSEENTNHDELITLFDSNENHENGQNLILSIDNLNQNLSNDKFTSPSKTSKDLNMASYENLYNISHSTELPMDNDSKNIINEIEIEDVKINIPHHTLSNKKRKVGF